MRMVNGRRSVITYERMYLSSSTYPLILLYLYS
eukprot:SAG31_NODE_30070_length_385_cov_5.342657_1_plen_32_part_01